MVRPLRHKENNDWKLILVGVAVVAVLALAPAVLERSARTNIGVSTATALG
jgi:anti-sigma-K factor RskA